MSKVEWGKKKFNAEILYQNVDYEDHSISQLFGIFAIFLDS